METEQIYRIPTTYTERDSLRKRIDTFVSSQKLVPPLSMDNLSELSEQFINKFSLDSEMKGWIMVEVNNSVWKDTVSSIPYDKRILLLPKCLSNSSKCKADVDELGLLCHRCKHCTIPDLEDVADKLGMMSIVAEGFTSVVGLIQNRVVDTVIGVGCLDSLEKAFPLLINNAVPGLAIPLNKSGCKDTTVDFEYVEQMLSSLSEKEIKLLDYDYLKSEIQGLFSNGSLKQLLSTSKDHTSQTAQEWLAGDGKRWRPYLLTAVYQSLSGEKTIPDDVRLAAVAVECFHKASLVHDDIQDNDKERYGKQTVHTTYGIPIAINIGDILLGEGYRLLAKTNNMELIKVIAEAHIDLCRGQGMELEWSLSPRNLTMGFVLDIFCNKTVPAFYVSLLMGLICAGDNSDLRKVLFDYSQALGIAYQLFDDIEDFETEPPIALRPSAILAVLCEQTQDTAFVEKLLHTNDLKSFLHLPENQFQFNNAISEVRRMAENYRRKALDVLNAITNIELKRLLFRVTKQILK